MSRLDLGKVVPEKGVDYWTIQDKQEIENDVKRDIKNINDLTNYELKTNTGSTIEMSVNQSNYVISINLKNSAGLTISTGSIDLPLESVVVDGEYDNSTKKLILTLQNGNTIEFSVADLISGLQSEITQSNKLSSDLVDDTNKIHKFVSSQEKNTWNNKSNFSGDYEDLSNKPTIPSALSDLTDDTAHRLVSDSEKTAWNSKSNFSGNYNDLTNRPTIPSEVTETIVSNWGFTKNSGDYTKPVSGIPKTDLSSDVRTSLDKADTALQSYNEQYTGTITGITMNGTSKGTSGVVDLGTVITEHQDISGKQNKITNINKLDADLIDDSNTSNKFINSNNLSKLNSIESGAEVNKIDSISVNNVNQSISNKNVDISIPTKLSDLTNDSGYTNNIGTITGITMNGVSKGTSGIVDLGTIITTHQDISGKQDTLVSGTNIKTINNESILGSGNLTVSGGANYTAGTGIDITNNEISCIFPNVSDYLSNNVYVGFFFGSDKGLTNLNNNSYQKWVLDEAFEANANGKYVVLINTDAYSEDIGVNTKFFIRPMYICTSGRGSQATTLQFKSVYSIPALNHNIGPYTTLVYNRETVTVTKQTSSYTVTSNNMGYSRANFLSIDYNGSNVFTPTNNNHPANKKYVDDNIATKQDVLVSGTNIKTINNQSLLGSGNITISGGGGGSTTPYIFDGTDTESNRDAFIDLYNNYMETGVWDLNSIVYKNTTVGGDVQIPMIGASHQYTQYSIIKHCVFYFVGNYLDKNSINDKFIFVKLLCSFNISGENPSITLFNITEETLARETSAESIAPIFTKGNAYSVGDYVMNNGKLYVCNTAISTAGTWPNESSNWTQTTIIDIIKNL